MTDLDSIADLDPLTGLPVVDHQSPTQRWRDALNHGSKQNPSFDTLEPQKHFGPVGAGTNTETLSVSDQRSNKTNTITNNINMNTNHDHGLLKASELKIENIERLLLQYGFDARIECDWVTVKMSRWSLFFNLVEDVPAVDLAGAFELREGISLRKTLRFLNYLNNENRVVRFSLWEPPSHDAIDLTDCWANVVLPIRPGFSRRQFIAALDLLFGGLDFAVAAAVEAGMADPVGRLSNQEVLSYGI